MAGSNFEVQLGRLADSQLAQEAPSLATHKVGFQLIDKDDDETRGVGVSVYNVNEQWIYIPVFYLNGRLRGLDLMFLPDLSQFMPAKENWIHYLKGRRPLQLGEAREEKDLMQGKPGSVSLTMRDPFLKGAALLRRDAWESMRASIPFDQDAFDLKIWIPRLGKQAAAAFTKALADRPDFANAVLRYYTPDDLRGLAKHADEVGTAPVEVPAAKGSSSGQTELKVITPATPDAAELADAEKEVLIRDGVFLVDNRKETSTVFRGDVDHRRLTSPAAAGLHDVLMADGSFNRFYVLFLNRGGNEGTRIEPSVRLVPLDEKGSFLGGRPKIQAMKLDLKPAEDTEILRSLGKAADPYLRNAKSARHLLVDDQGNCYDINLAWPLVGTLDGKVRARMHIGRPTTKRDVEFLAFTGKPGRLFIGGDTLFVPEGTRALTPMEPDREEKEYIFGTPNTLVEQLINKVGLKPLKVYSDGSAVTVTMDNLSEGPLGKIAAVVCLAKRFGIAAATAKQMVKEACLPRRPNAIRYLIKLAQTAGDPYIPTQEGSIRASAAPLSYEEQKMSLGALRDMDTAVRASDAGIKEVMDVSVLRNLAMTTQVADLIGDYLPDLMRGMDRVGRLLFLFYWHNDEFKEKYGNEDMAELERSLRDVFQSMSDLILYLSKKTVSTDRAVAALAGDLSEDLAV